MEGGENDLLISVTPFHDSDQIIFPKDASVSNSTGSESYLDNHYIDVNPKVSG